MTATLGIGVSAPRIDARAPNAVQFGLRAADRAHDDARGPARAGLTGRARAGVTNRQPSATQGRPPLRGAVVERATSAPIAGVEVSIVGSAARASTDSVGAFAIARPASGSAVLVFRRLGLHPGTLAVSLAPNDTTPLVFAMDRVAQELGEVTIEGEGVTGLSARLAGFEERRARGVGRFITDADIERRRSARTSDLLLDVPGIDVRKVDLGGTIVISRRGMKLQPGTGMPVECPIPVVVDGGMRISDLNDVPPQLIAGIEVYAGPGTVPQQYANMSNYTQCGLVLIWTKSGTPRR